MHDGDNIMVFKISDSISNLVTISGAITRPGQYEFENNMTLTDLIKKAGGLLGNAYTKRSNLIRSNLDGSESFSA